MVIFSIYSWCSTRRHETKILKDHEATLNNRELRSMYSNTVLLKVHVYKQCKTESTKQSQYNYKTT